MVKIDSNSLDIKSLQISASRVLHSKSYSDFKNRGGRFVPPVMNRVKEIGHMGYEIMKNAS